MATDKRALYERMDVTERPAPARSNARDFACAETIVLFFIIAAGCALVFLLNTLVPKAW